MKITMRAEARKRSLASIKRYADAQGYFQQRTGDLDGACFVPEFAYWSTPPRHPAE